MKLYAINNDENLSLIEIPKGLENHEENWKFWDIGFINGCYL